MSVGTEVRPFTTALTSNLTPDEQRLARAMSELHALSNRSSPWMADETFSCDGGALAAKMLADRIGLDTELTVGIYHHDNPEVRARQLGEDTDDWETADEYGAIMDSVSDSMDEHHHWLTITRTDGNQLILDPNGPYRDEAYIAVLDFDMSGRYDPRSIFIVYDPSTGADQIARDQYPGLESAVGAALQASSDI